MPFYKDIDNKVHCLDSADFEWLLPIGSSQISIQEVAELQNVPLSQSEIVANYEAGLDAHLDSVAKAHRYDNRITFSLRAGYSGPFQAEGIAFAQWMDECYVLSNQIKNAVIAGEQEMPSIEAFIAAMPEFVLP